MAELIKLVLISKLIFVYDKFKTKSRDRKTKQFPGAAFVYSVDRASVSDTI